MSKPAVIERDFGWRRIRRQVRELDKIEARVGVLADKNTARSDGPTNVEVAFWNEFGTDATDSHPGIPERPFMRHTADENRRKVGVLGEGYLKKIIDGSLEPRMALTRIAMWFAGQIQKTMANSKSWATPNAESTIDAKGSDTPLIDTGQLRRSISHVVQMKGRRSD